MRFSLLVKLILILAATGLLPLTISFSLLRFNKNALDDQLAKTHMVAARTTAKRVEAFLEPLVSVARTIAQTAIHQAASSPAMQELLTGALQAPTGIVAVKIFNAEGGEVITAQHPDAKGEIDLLYAAEAPALDFLQGRTRRWLRLIEPLPEEAGQVVLIARTESLDEVVTSVELGDEASLTLADFDGTVLFGLDRDLAAFPSEAVAVALSGKARSGSKKYAGPETEEGVMVAYATVVGAPWVVLSRQPTRLAAIAAQRIRRAAWVAAALALLLTAALSSLAHATVIRPLRRLIRAQQDLAGGDVSAEGSEIAQLEASFALLEQRVRDQQDLGKIVLGRYQVVEVLGSGAMGTVFKAWDPKLERPLALKTIRLESEEVKREKLVSTLLREAKTSAGFHHPNIVTVYDAADEGAAAFIAMEFVDGITLEQLIAAQGRLEWRQVVPLGAAVARGLAEAHAHQLVHQDVKPANILLGRDGSIKVTDFGISQLISSASASEGVICGTPGYIAPECLEGAGFSPRSDLFGLGVLLYECLTGEHPFAGRTLRITIVNTINKAPGALDELHPDMPPALRRLILQLLEKNPDRRPADAESVAQAFDRMARDLDLSWTTLRPPGPGPVHRARPGTRHAQLLSVRQTRALTTRVSPDA